MATATYAAGCLRSRERTNIITKKKLTPTTTSEIKVDITLEGLKTIKNREVALQSGCQIQPIKYQATCCWSNKCVSLFVQLNQILKINYVVT